MDRLDRVQRAATLLQTLDVRIVEFRLRIAKYPGRLSHLAYPIKTSDLTSCGGSQNYGNPQVSNWVSWGPFTGYAISAGVGTQTPLGLADDLLVRVPASATIGVLKIVVSNADFEDVSLLDDVVDGGDGIAAGSIRWQAPAADGSVVLEYAITTNNSC